MYSLLKDVFRCQLLVVRGSDFELKDVCKSEILHLNSEIRRFLAKGLRRLYRLITGGIIFNRFQAFIRCIP